MVTVGTVVGLIPLAATLPVAPALGRPTVVVLGAAAMVDLDRVLAEILVVPTLVPVDPRTAPVRAPLGPPVPRDDPTHPTALAATRCRHQ